MAAPDPEGVGLLAKVIAAGAAVVVPIWGARTWLEKKFEKKADKHSVANQFQSVTLELTTQRGHIAKIFDQMRDDRSAAEMRHREVLMHLLENKK